MSRQEKVFDCTRFLEQIGLKDKDIGEQTKEMGVSYATFHELVKGKHDPTPATLCKIADYYGVSTDYLLGRSDK